MAGINFATEAELEEAMNNDQTGEILAAVLSNEITIGATVEEHVPEEPVVQEFEAPVQQTSVIGPDSVREQIEAQSEEIRLKLEREYKTRTEGLENQLAAILAKNKEFEERLAAPVVTPEPVKSLEPLSLEEEDPDLVSSWERNNRSRLERLEEVLKGSNSTSPEVLAQISELRGLIKEDKDARELSEKADQAEKANKLWFSQLDGFVKGKKELELPKTVSESYQEQLDLKAVISNRLGCASELEAEAMYRKVIAEDTVWARNKRAEFDKMGIAIPEYSRNYINLLELVESQRGQRFDTKKMKYEDTSLGLEEFYKLRNLGTIADRIAAVETKEIQDRLTQQATAAIVLDNNLTSDITGESYTEEEISKYMDLPANEINNNPTIVRKLSKFYKDLGIPLPAGLTKKD